jgi:hypothetical protein
MRIVVAKTLFVVRAIVVFNVIESLCNHR